MTFLRQTDKMKWLAKVCAGFMIDTDNLNIVKQGYQNVLYLEDQEIGQKMTQY